MRMRPLRLVMLAASALVLAGWAGSPSSGGMSLILAREYAPISQSNQSHAPLYEGLQWHNLGEKLESVNINKELPLLASGTDYQSDAISVKLPGEVVSFYSPESLSTLGWLHVSDSAGVLSIASTYFKSPNTYLTIRFADCSDANAAQAAASDNSGGYCVHVWVSLPDVSVEAPIISQPESKPQQDVAPNGSIAIQYANPLPVPLFSQNDSTWRSDRQGFSDAGYPNACDFCTLGYIDSAHTGYGCWVASYAMLYNYYYPNFTNPRDLNNKLNTGPGNGPRYASNGAHCNNLMPGGSPYAPSGVIRGSNTYNNCAQSNCIDAPNVTLIDNEINAGRPLLAFVHYSGVNPQHMVVITGHNGNAYYINDPWTGQRLTLATGALGPYVVDWLYTWNGRISTTPGRLQIRNVQFNPTQVVAGNLLEVRVDVVNDGNAPISVMGPDNNTYDENGGGWRNSECGKWRVGIDFDGRPSSMIDHPYRFGRDETLAPGDSRVYGGYIRLTSSRSADFWAGVVQECNHWEQDGTGRARISIQPNTSTMFASGWEDGQPLGYENSVQYGWNVAGYYNTDNPSPEASRTSLESYATSIMAPNGGARYLRVAGYSQSSYAYVYFRLFDANILINNGMKLRYWIYDYQRSTFAIDGHFTDGNTLRDFDNGDRLRDQNGVRIHPTYQGSYGTGQWRYVEVDLSRAAGHTLDSIMVAYDNGNDGYIGQVRAYIDNVSIGY